MSTVDTHCHASLWWFEPLETLLFQMDRNGVDKAVLVQHRGEFDNGYLLEAARANPGRFAVMGLVDTTQPDAPQTLATWHARGVEGVRLSVPGRPEDGDSTPVWRKAAELGMPVSSQSHALELTTEPFKRLIEELSTLPIIIEHYGFLRLPEEQWEEGLAQAPDYIDRALAAFGAGRLMLATDYPPSASREGYANVVGLLREYLTRWSTADREAVLGGTAESLFRFATA